MLCSDGVIRVVKFNYPAQWNRSLFHEFVCYRLAELLELPVLNQIFVRVPTEVAEAYSTVEGMSDGIKVGTPYVDIEHNLANDGLLREPLPSLYGSCRNVTVIPGIFAFDIWVHNSDRGANMGNILVVPDKAGARHLFLNDHGYAFMFPGATMERYKMLREFRGASLTWQQHMFPSGPIYESMKIHIDLMDSNNNPFLPFIERIQAVEESELVGIMEQVPDEWSIPDFEKDAVVSFLYERRQAVRLCIDSLVSRWYFTFWNGGGLAWPDSCVNLG